LGFVDVLNTIPDVKFAVFARQDGDHIKGSIRSDEFKNVNVFKIAQLFGGGGHKLASGFRVKGRLVKIAGGKWRVE
jgi:phosphoesterase RecJ-like protein